MVVVVTDKSFFGQFVEFDFDFLQELNLVAHVLLLDFSAANELGDEEVNFVELLSVGTVALQSLFKSRDVLARAVKANCGA